MANNEPTREYPFAHILRDSLNRSHRRINLLNTLSMALLVLAAILGIIAMLL